MIIIKRGNQVIIPRGNTVIEENDILVLNDCKAIHSGRFNTEDDGRSGT